MTEFYRCPECGEQYSDKSSIDHKCWKAWIDERVQNLEEPPPAQVKIKLMRLGAKLPAKAHANDAGFDVSSASDIPHWLNPGGRALIPLGFAMELPPGYEAQIRPRSGLAKKNGILVHLGTIDATYRGETAAIVFNFGQEVFCVHPGDRIAQMVIQRVPEIELVQVDQLSDSDRGAAGFGSTGVKGAGE